MCLKGPYLQRTRLLSPAISDHWTFEEELFCSHHEARVIGYDPTITSTFWLKRVVGHVGAMTFRFDTKRAGRLFDWVRYRKDSSDGTRHEHRSIRNWVTTARIPKASTRYSAVFWTPRILKVDIEGSESQVLDQIVRNAAQIASPAW